MVLASHDFIFPVCANGSPLHAVGVFGVVARGLYGQTVASGLRVPRPSGNMECPRGGAARWSSHLPPGGPRQDRWISRIREVWA